MAGAVKKVSSDRALREAAQQFKMLADATRLLILGALARGAENVGSMAILVGMNQPAVSHHLSLLRAAKFVETKRDRHAIIYTITDLGRTMWALAEKLPS